VLHFPKPGILPIKLSLVKLLKAVQHWLQGLSRVKEDGPFPIPQDKLVDRFAALNLALTGPQATEEGFQIIVGAVAFGPGVAGKEPRPALPEGRADVADHRGVFRMALYVLFQVRQKFLDLSLNMATGGVGLGVFVRIKPPLQLDHPPLLTFELPILTGKGLATLHHRQQDLQQRMAPLFRLRRSEASRRAKSSKTRRPPRAKGGLLPSVSVDRINSA
jgi:hypothetical protein